MKSLVLLLVTLCATLSVYAEVAVTRFDFSESGTSDTGSNWPGEGNWTNAFAKACKARLNGIGIAPPSSSGGQSGMKYTCPEGETETIRQLSVTCMASGTTAAKETNFHKLGIAINGESVESEPFTFNGEIDTPHTIVFTFDEAVSASSIVITNETDQANNSSLFEIYAVEWQSDYSTINASFSAPSAITVATPLTVELLSISGGSGSYAESYFTFNGESITVESGTGTVTFESPANDGTYPLTLTVTDSNGTQEIFTRTITVTAYVAPTNLRAFDITRNGFELTWDQPLSTSIIEYIAKVKPSPNYYTTPSLSPTWKTVDDGLQTETEIDLSDYLKSFRLKMLTLSTPSWSGDLFFSTDKGETWNPMPNPMPYINSLWTLSNFPDDAKTLLLKTTSSTPPEKFTFTLTFDTVAEIPFAATGGARLISVTDLPAGKTYSVTVTAVYQNDDGSTIAPASTPITVSLLPLPPFASATANVKQKTITLTWPEGDEDIPGCCQFFGTPFTSSTLQPGLYLTRVYLTSNPAGKAIVITNTSQNDIRLNDGYTYSITNTSTDKTTPWEFGEDDAPYTVPAGGELIFYSSAYSPAEIQAGAIPVSKNVLKNITEDYTLSLRKGDTICNELTPKTNATVCLKADSITETETHTTNPLDALYTPWITPAEPILLGEVSFESISGQRQLFYSKYLNTTENLQCAEAHCFLQDDTSQSEKIILPIYEAESLIKPGFILRLH